MAKVDLVKFSKFMPRKLPDTHTVDSQPVKLE